MTGQQTSSSRWFIQATLVLVLAVVYRIYLHDTIGLMVGIGRVVQPIEDFPWDCMRLRHPLLEGCEDIWLDHQDRKLYAACTSLPSRQGWLPGGSHLNVSARSRTDHISVLNIDHPGPDGLYGLHTLSVGDEYTDDLDLVGFDVRKVAGGLRFWLINHRPPVNPTTGEFLDAWAVGSNATIEVFDLTRGSSTLKYVKTIVSEALVAPNNLAVDDDGVGFMVTNEHGSKVGALREINAVLGDGIVSYCRTDTGKCQIATNRRFAYPNGIVKARNGLFYIAQSSKGIVSGHRLEEGRLVQIDEIPLGMPIDNLSFDAQGNLIVAGLPDIMRFRKSAKDPYTLSGPGAVLMVHQLNTHPPEQREGYKVSKMVEDREGKRLPGTTVATHDVESHRLFLGGVFSPFLGICASRV
ncbi:hypothetical protein NUU61_004050 [Penicillium alfredii]|uniref:SMP-30/Gluconolactonase/LRE-like region domain-containing protein n=1 Tax=Penicillium alfredii TaxID=1506179 RepID=A0A9W9FKE0_9EURO|nr:uncharacterized protein NUU61_004050 [Penicillium alfredii]KAJ5101828.1 hypothetical protein NUU61_004050 [Penicillium alfredii]